MVFFCFVTDAADDDAAAIAFHNSDEILSQTEKQRYDGWFNNLAHPAWGSCGKFKLVSN